MNSSIQNNRICPICKEVLAPSDVLLIQRFEDKCIVNHLKENSEGPLTLPYPTVGLNFNPTSAEFRHYEFYCAERGFDLTLEKNRGF